MSVTSRLTITRKQAAGPCTVCEQDLPAGEVYGTVTLRLGQTKAGKSRWASAKVHLSECLAKWVVMDYVRFTYKREKQRGGRPVGTGLAQRLDPEQVVQRKHLVRTRA